MTKTKVHADDDKFPIFYGVVKKKEYQREGFVI